LGDGASDPVNVGKEDLKVQKLLIYKNFQKITHIYTFFYVAKDENI